MKLMNLDDLAKVERQVTIKGQVYDVAEQTVEMMIHAIKLSDDIRKSGEKDIGNKMFTEAVKTARMILPGAGAGVIEGLSLRQLTALMDFATASDTEVVEGSAATDEEVLQEGKSE